MNDESFKHILLATPTDFDLHFLIEKNLIHQGFIVTKILSQTTEFKYKNVGQRLKNLFHKVILNDRNFKKKLVANFRNNQLKAQISKHPSYDYALFIRADFFEDEILELSRIKTNLMVSYHYDGLDRSPKIYTKIKYFDKFFVFDPRDLKNTNYSFLPCTNFFFDYDILDTYKESTSLKFYFLGSYHKSRMKGIIDFHKHISNRGLSSLFQIVSFDLKNISLSEYEKTNIKFLDAFISFEDYIENIKNTEIIVDFVINEHIGVSFRIFEGIKYKKKVITTNSAVKEYDFFHPNNIYILDNSNYDGLDEFLEKPFINISDAIFEKYRFNNWINYILDINPHTPILLPIKN